MNKLIPISLLFTLFFFTTSQAQLNVVKDGSVNFEGTSRSSITVSIEPERKDAEKALENYLNKTFDVKLKGGGMLKAEEIVLGSVSGKKMDLYAEVSEQNDLTKIQIWGRFGYDIFITKDKYPEEYQALRTTLDDFLGEYLTEFYQDQIREGEKELASTQKDKEKNIKSTDKLADKNAKNREKIADLQEDIDENETEMQTLETTLGELDNSINTQNETLDDMRAKLQFVSTKK